MSAGKRRINVCLDGDSKVCGVAWYGSTNAEDVEGLIKKASYSASTGFL